MFKTILIALDGSKHADKALKVAIEMAQQCEAKLILYHAVKITNLMPGYDKWVNTDAREAFETVAMEQATLMLDAAEKQVRDAGLADFERKLQQADSATHAILAIAEAEQVDLLVVGTRGLTGLRELAMGSVAHKVTAAATCPVLVVR